MGEEYVEKIILKVRECKDIALLDMILKILVASK